jgi:hypothetical protein
MRLKGKIQRKDAIIRIDSRSSTSLLSETLASELKGAAPVHRSVKVKVANGAVMQGNLGFPECHTTFVTSFKVIPLECYDAIIGMDWL